MNRARARRLVATVSILSLFAFQAFAGPAGAAVPDALFSSQPIPEHYDGAHAAGFRGTFQLTDNSTLSKLFLRIDAVASEGTNVYLLVTRNGTDVTNKCVVSTDDAADFACEFKTVRNTDRFVAVSAYGPTGAAVNVAFIWSSTGVPQNGDRSHGDNWDAITRTATRDSTGNYSGGFTRPGDTTIANAPIGPGNVQAARMVGLPANVAAFVNDAATGTCTTTPTVNCATQFGEWVETVVGDGQNFNEWQLQIIYASGTPKGFVHTFGSPLQQEFVGPCAKKSPTLPCFTWSAKDNTATIRTIHNGSWKGL